MTNNAEEIRERCKTETNIEIGMAKIEGVDEGGEAEGAEDEKNLMSGRRTEGCAQT